MTPCSRRNSASPSTRSSSATSPDGHPARPRPRRRRAAGRRSSQDRHLEVEDHEVGVVVDALDPAEERPAHALEAGLLPQLPHHGLGQGLAPLDPPAGHRPLPRAGPWPRRTISRSRRRTTTAPTHTSGRPPVAVVTSGRPRGPGAGARRWHGPPGRRTRRSSWSPGPRAGRRRRRRRTPAPPPSRSSSSISTSPTPTPRASGSTKRSPITARCARRERARRRRRRSRREHVVEAADQHEPAPVGQVRPQRRLRRAGAGRPAAGRRRHPARPPRGPGPAWPDGRGAPGRPVRPLAPGARSRRPRWSPIDRGPGHRPAAGRPC